MGGVRMNGLLFVEECVDDSEMERCVSREVRELSKDVHSAHSLAGRMNHARHPTRPLSAKQSVGRRATLAMMRWCDRRLRSLRHGICGSPQGNCLGT